MTVRLAHVQLLPLITGVQTVTLEELRRIDRSVFEPWIICQGPGPLTEAAEAAGIQCLYVPDLVRKISPARDSRALFQLRSVLREKQFDIVHTHSSKTGILGRVAGRLAGVPVVMHTVHGYAFPAARGSSERLLFHGIEYLGARCCDAMVVLKEDDRLLARNTLHFAASKLHLLPNGVDVSRYRPRATPERDRLRRERLGIGSGTFAVGMVGRLWPQKNPATLLEAVPKLLAGTKANVAVYFIGDGELRETLEARVAELGLQKRVTFLGWRTDVPELLAALDVFALPSRWEGLPLAILEALSSAVPVVASDIAGNRDAVNNGVDGLLFADGDSNQMAACLSRLANDPNLRRSMSTAGRGKIEADYRLEDRVARMERLYLQLLRERAPERLNGFSYKHAG
jgi:glycosyltransferase involved in cell wall biosynthesis